MPISVGFLPRESEHLGRDVPHLRMLCSWRSRLFLLLLPLSPLLYALHCNSARHDFTCTLFIQIPSLPIDKLLYLIYQFHMSYYWQKRYKESRDVVCGNHSLSFSQLNASRAVPSISVPTGIRTEGARTKSNRVHSFLLTMNNELPQ